MNSCLLYTSSRDDLGNIFAGYFAKVYGMPLDILHLGAGIYQARGGNINWDWFSTAFDDPRAVSYTHLV